MLSYDCISQINSVNVSMSVCVSMSIAFDHKRVDTKRCSEMKKKHFLNELLSYLCAVCGITKASNYCKSSTQTN